MQQGLLRIAARVLISLGIALLMTLPVRPVENAGMCEVLHPRMKRQDVKDLGFTTSLDQRDVQLPTINGVGCSIRMSDDLGEVSKIVVFYDRPREGEKEVREYAISLVKELVALWGFPSSWTAPYYYNGMEKLAGNAYWTCSGAYRASPRHQVSFDIHDGQFRTTVHSFPCMGSTIPEYRNVQ